MTVLSPTGYSAPIIQQLSSLRSNLDDLSRQMSSGEKAETYGGLGSDRTVALAFQGKLTDVQAYQQTIGLMTSRFTSINNTLNQVDTVRTDMRGGLDENRFDLLSDGTTAQQRQAKLEGVSLVGLLNSDVAGRYIFAGKQIDKAPVKDFDTILNGTGGAAGFLQVASERRQADVGDGHGRLTLTSAAGTATIAEDGTHPFGFKLDTVSSTLSNATVTGPTGTPPAASVAFSGQPTANETIAYTFKLPDGTSSVIKLTAGTANDATLGTFAIGATPQDTADNLNAVLDQSVQTLAKTDLVAASAMQAGNEFFGTFQGQAPQRVAGPPFATATALQNGTATDTVAWYTGDQTASSPRNDLTAKVDGSVTVGYGMRANEQAFSHVMASLAVMQAVDVSGGTANDKALHSAMVSRVKSQLGEPDGTQTIQSVEMEIAASNKAMTMASDRHKSAAGTYQQLLDDTLGIDKNEVATKLLSLQTQMQASYQATSIMYKLSLTNYL